MSGFINDNSKLLRRFTLISLLTRPKGSRFTGKFNSMNLPGEDVHGESVYSESKLGRLKFLRLNLSWWGSDIYLGVRLLTISL